MLDTLHEPGQGGSRRHLWGADLLAPPAPAHHEPGLRPYRARPRDRCGPSWVPLQIALGVLALPLVVAGLAALVAVAPRRALFTLVVPLYQVAFQSIVHFEFRYVLPMHACLLVFAGAAPGSRRRLGRG
jgi:hypothetical protein